MKRLAFLFRQSRRNLPGRNKHRRPRFLRCFSPIRAERLSYPFDRRRPVCDAISSVSAASQNALRGEINIALAKKSLDNLRLQGDAQAQMLEVAVKLSVQAGKGETLDLVG
jgi:hypothetical protein